MLNIAHVIDAPFPAKTYGGTERALLNLAKAQVQQGHKVRVLCREITSDIEGLMLAVGWPNSPEEWKNFKMDQGIDLVHFHGLPMDQIQGSDLPFLSSVQGNGKAGESFHPNSVFVSANHAQRHSSEIFVYNSLDLSDYPLRKASIESSKGVAFLGKASWAVKNLKGASKILSTSPYSLEVMGGSRWKTPWAFFNPKLHFHGMVDDKQKVNILHQCRSLLFPILWHEPFGIALIEALATGIPVAGHPFGSLPEIVTPDVGLLSTKSDDLLNFIDQGVRDVQPEACRSRVEENFSPKISAQKFEGFYQQILEGKMLNPLRPHFTQDPLDIPKVDT